MKKILIFIVILSLVALTGCGSGETTVDRNPFLGGDVGVDMKFTENNPPSLVDTGENIDIEVTVKNMGGYTVESGDFVLKIVGVSTSILGFADETDYIKTNIDELPKRKKSEGGDYFESYITYPTTIGGIDVEGEFPYTLTAEACYKYGTDAVIYGCTQDNLRGEDKTKCGLTGSKEVYNSGAPVQVKSAVQSVRNKDTLRYILLIEKVSDGAVFRQDSTTCEENNKIEDMVFFEISSLNIDNDFECSNLRNKDGTAKTTKDDVGYVKIRKSEGGNQKATIVCEVTLQDSELIKAEPLINVKLIYRYEDYIEKEDFTVRHEE